MLNFLKPSSWVQKKEEPVDTSEIVAQNVTIEDEEDFTVTEAAEPANEESSKAGSSKKTPAKRKGAKVPEVQAKSAAVKKATPSRAAKKPAADAKSEDKANGATAAAPPKPKTIAKAPASKAPPTKVGNAPAAEAAKPRAKTAPVKKPAPITTSKPPPETKSEASKKTVSPAKLPAKSKPPPVRTSLNGKPPTPAGKKSYSFTPDGLAEMLNDSDFFKEHINSLLSSVSLSAGVEAVAAPDVSPVSAKTAASAELLSDRLDGLSAQVDALGINTQESGQTLKELAQCVQKIKVEEKEALRQQALREAGTFDLDVKAAQEAYQSLSKSDISELKCLKTPPPSVGLVCEALCVALQLKPARVKSPTGKSKMVDDYWPTTKQLFAEADGLFQKLRTFEPSQLNESTLKKLQTYTENPALSINVVRAQSKAAASFALWLHAVVKLASKGRTPIEEARFAVASLISRNDALEAIFKSAQETVEALKVQKAELMERVTAAEARDATKEYSSPAAENLPEAFRSECAKIHDGVEETKEQSLKVISLAESNESEVCGRLSKLEVELAGLREALNP